MKTALLTLALFLIVFNSNFANIYVIKQHLFTANKLDIKIKNDSEEDMDVINTASGGHYKLSKNVITTIKMNVGDKLYTEVKGKKGTLLLTASAETSSKVQLISALVKK